MIFFVSHFYFNVNIFAPTCRAFAPLCSHEPSYPNVQQNATNDTGARV